MELRLDAASIRSLRSLVHHRQTPKAHSYPESTPILRLDDLELLVDDGLHADGFVMQALEFAKALHPLRLVGAGAPAAQEQLVAQCIRDKFLERLTALGRSRFGLANKVIGKVKRRIHRPILAYLWAVAKYVTSRTFLGRRAKRNTPFYASKISVLQGGRKTAKLRWRTPPWQPLAAWNRRASRSSPDPRDFERQMARPAQDRAAPVGGRVVDEAGAIQAAGELGQRDLRLDPGERCAEADVHAAAEAEVLIVLAGRVKVVGVAEALRVAAAGGEHEDERRTLGNGDTRDFDIGERRALRQHVDRGFVAQQLLDGAGQQRGRAAQQLQRFGAAEQREHAVSDQVDGRLMSGDEQQDRGGHQFHTGKAAFGAGVVDERGEHVVGGFAPAAVGEVAEV